MRAMRQGSIVVQTFLYPLIIRLGDTASSAAHANQLMGVLASGIVEL